jgi:Protein of unknown function (DUF1571)
MRFPRNGLGRQNDQACFNCGRWTLPSIVVAVAATVTAGEDPQGSSVATKTAAGPSSAAATGSAAGTTAAQSTKAKTADSPSSQPNGRGRVALADSKSSTHAAKNSATVLLGDSIPAASVEETPIAKAIRMIGDCQVRYQTVNDYTCTFYKRERVEGNLTPLHVMTMKVRTKPQSIYLRFQRPAHGREAIFIAGRNSGRILAHDVGLNKLLAGTLQLEPTSAQAMEDNRHPITEAGIGPLIDTVAKRWAVELNPDDSILTFRDDMLVGSSRCWMIESTHPHRRPHFLFHKVKVYIDQELGLPIRFEAYDWPKLPHAEAELMEEYNYGNLKLNVGLHDIDFDIANTTYSFGRF